MELFFCIGLRRDLLTHAFTHPDQEFYVRELASLIVVDPGNLSRELKKLEAEGLFQSKFRGNQKYYSLNKRYPLFAELKKMVFKTEGVAGSLKDAVNKFSGVSSSFIYGSYAKEKEKTSSDVDLIIVGRVPRAEFTREIRHLESQINREINFTSYTEEEFEKERKKEGGFLNLILKGKIFLLKGKLRA